jgi:hypothetical protein
MRLQRRECLLLTAMAAAVATPALAQTQASIPDLSGIWWHQSLPGMEPPASGPGPVTNLMRRKDNGASDYNQLVGNHKNPILKPQTA